MHAVGEKYIAAAAHGAGAEIDSLHGQGIARLGSGLAVEATAPDGLTEAVRRGWG